MRAKVADGTGLAQAMGQHPKVFNELAVSMVRAGQEGGFLEDVLKRIATFVETPGGPEVEGGRGAGLPGLPGRSPAFMVVNVLMIFFVPQFEPIFEKLKEKGELPTLTTMLMASATSSSRTGGSCSCCGAVGAVAFRKWAATPSGRLLVDKAKIRLPLFGPVFLSLALSRFSRILGTMLHNGIPILQGAGHRQGLDRQPGAGGGHREDAPRT